MLYCVESDELLAMIEGKGWMSGWDPGNSINERNLITETEARKIVESWSECL